MAWVRSSPHPTTPEYAPFGEQLDSTAEQEKLAYTGKEHDGATGLTYFGAR